MFGIRLVIGAQDQTARVVQDIGSRLRQLSRSIRTVFTLGGLIYAFRQLGSVIDSAFKASTYAKQWDELKSRISSGFSSIMGRIADAWGPWLENIDRGFSRIMDWVNRIISKIQWAGAFMGALFEGEGFGHAKKTADEVVESMRKEYEERKRMLEQEKHAAEAQKQADAAATERARVLREAHEKAKEIAEAELEHIRQTGGDTRYERDPVTMLQKSVARMNAIRAQIERNAALDWAGRGIFESFKRPKTFGYHAMAEGESTPTALEAGLAGMSEDELSEAVLGPSSRLRAIARGAREEARRARRLERLINEARRRQALNPHGRLSPRMVAALRIDALREQKERDRQRADNVERAVMNMNNRVEQLTQEIVGSLSQEAS